MSWQSVIRKLALSLLGFVLLLSALIMSAIHSQTGLRLLLGSIEAPLYAAGIQLHAKSATGTLLEFTLPEVIIKTDSIHADIANLSICWRPLSLLNGVVEIQSIFANSIQGQYSPTNKPSKPRHFPFRIVIDQLNIKALSLKFASGSVDGHLQFQTQPSLSWDIALQTHNLDMHDFTPKLNGPLALTIVANQLNQIADIDTPNYQLKWKSQAQPKAMHYLITTLSVQSPMGLWALSHPSDIELLTNRISLSTLCLSNHAATLCANGQWQPTTLNGQIMLKNAAMDWPSLGINIHAINVLIDASNQQLHITGAAQSGPGSIKILGEANADLSQPTLNLGVKGHDFLIADLPEYTVFINPDLQYRYANHKQAVEGNITIDKALINVGQLQNKNPAESDIVYVDENNYPIDNQQSLAMELKLNLVVGRNVILTGFGIQTHIDGQLNIVSLSGSSLSAIGKLQLHQGTYENYGKRFIITHGELVYAHSPLNNPNLDIKASYDLPPSNSGNLVNPSLELGANILGTLNKPIIELYSNPSLSQEDILSYIVLGQPFSQVQEADKNILSQAAMTLASSGGGNNLLNSIQKKLGISQLALGSLNSPPAGTDNAIGETAQDTTAVFIGKTITPRLYVRYGIGLFNNQQELDTSLQLSKYWSFKTNAGTQAQGADMVFTINR
ncbi:MAG: translocation/assembly module TamB domain-containing protein [Gammaproteobacteria bacterium]|nr:translocation/assembly module TamB domain-containing protein [Gammaproteobacteria bacterium]